MQVYAVKLIDTEILAFAGNASSSGNALPEFLSLHRMSPNRTLDELFWSIGEGLLITWTLAVSVGDLSEIAGLSAALTV